MFLGGEYPAIKEYDTRTAIHDQVGEHETVEETIPYTDEQQAIIDRFESLPGKCIRKAGRMVKGGPSSWSTLLQFIEEHEVVGHTHK